MKVLRNLIPLTFVVVLLAEAAYTAPFTLTDGNSEVTIYPAGVSGMYNWGVNGVDHLFRHWYWYRIGTTDPESPINTISAPTVDQPLSNKATVSFADQQGRFTLNVTYLLTGGAPGELFSMIDQEVVISNTSTNTLEFYLFAYYDFDFWGTSINDIVKLLDSSTIIQYDAFLPGVAIVQVNPVPLRWEIGGYPSIRNKLDNDYADDLTNTGSPFGPGDATFAFQWGFFIDPGSEVRITSRHMITPEPSSAIVLGAGLIVLLGLRRRKHTV